MFLVLSTSLNPDSRSRILAAAAASVLRRYDYQLRLMDLLDYRLPACDGDDCYGDPNVVEIAMAIRNAMGILIATPIYNFDVSSSAKNMIELTGSAWTEKVVGFLCAAGGHKSYMAPMALANSLMFDFRTFVIPSFVYATRYSFNSHTISDPDVHRRIEELVDQLVRVSIALHR
jgi:FMN reductase